MAELKAIELVCESDSCNPGVQQLDQKIDDYRKSIPTTMMDGVVVAPPENLIDELKRLRYTSHYAINELMHHFKCAKCGNVRQWGELNIAEERIN